MHGWSIRKHPFSLLDRPGARSDPLTDVLSLVDGRALFSKVFSAGGAWSMRMTDIPPGVKFGAVLQGWCWLVIDGFEPRRIVAGDCYLLTGDREYRLASDLTRPPVDFRSIAGDADEVAFGDGPNIDVRIAGGRFVYDGSGAALLKELLPPVLHVPAGCETAGILAWVLDRLRSELAGTHLGSTVMAEYLANMMFVQMLRIHAANALPETGWLRALSDASISAALLRIHQEPMRRWTVAELARTVGLSRSTFALRFKALVGAAPLDYVLRWRVRLAEHALQRPDATVGGLAEALGYESESAFSNAFKRVNGSAPSHYRAARQASRKAADLRT